MRYATTLAATVFLAGAASAAPNSAPKGSLSAAITTTAGDIQAYLKENETTVTLGEFAYGVTSDKEKAGGRQQASAGPLIRQALGEALARKGIEVRAKSPVTITATYIEIEAKNLGTQQVKIKFAIRRGGEDGLEYAHVVTDPQAVAVLLGLTASFPPDADPDSRGRLLKTAADAAEKGERTFAPKNAEVRSDRDSKFAVLVRVAGGKTGPHPAGDYETRLPENTDGAAFVPVKRDEVYGLELVNDADFDAGALVRIDGLSLFSFSDKEFRGKDGVPLYSFLIVPAKSKVFVRGWHVTNDHSDEFKVTEYAKSAAAELKSSAPTGTITVSFHAAWDPAGQAPADEPKNATKNSLGDATGRGARFEQKYVEVNHKVGVARAVVSVRYQK